MVQRPGPVPDVVVEDLDDDVCLYRPVDDEVVVLNSSAAAVWRLADGTLSVAEIVERVATAYSLAAAELESDVHQVVDDLVARGFLVEAADSA